MYNSRMCLPKCLGNCVQQQLFSNLRGSDLMDFLQLAIFMEMTPGGAVYLYSWRPISRLSWSSSGMLPCLTTS
ncbi:hypothetical protein NP493_527g04001 [Ridgeia piscesae]|uniref:Uncharacterized protein n=1 Tax=Ridgeia piscesae TaxID=27915 RepID=A0AAD9NTH4_RIDPI|nr:hypothetical protein NP493_527g04001 [Ridgeia piscesae]